MAAQPLTNNSPIGLHVNPPLILPEILMATHDGRIGQSALADNTIRIKCVAKVKPTFVIIFNNLRWKIKISGGSNKY
jgi:hypothetical protein